MRMNPALPPAIPPIWAVVNPELLLLEPDAAAVFVGDIVAVEGTEDVEVEEEEDGADVELVGSLVVVGPEVLDVPGG